MSTYTLKCGNCGKEFDITARMSDMDTKYCKGIICPECNTSGQCNQLIKPSVIVSGYHTNFRVPDGFKDILNNIKKKNPGNKINI